MGDYFGPASQQAQTQQPQAPPQQQQQQQTKVDSGKIFVGGLSWQTTEESLRWHFEQYGAVASVDVMRDRVTGDPRGFAFVVFHDPSTVDLVMKDKDNHEINHKFVDVKRAQARGIAPPSIHEKAEEVGAAAPVPQRPAQKEPELSPEQLQNKVFVGGIPPHIDRDALKQLFEQFGPVTDAIVMLDQATMRSRCFGFVTFENGSNGAHKAIAAQPLNVDGRQVEVKLATPRAEQQKPQGQNRVVVPAGPKHVGLRAGISQSSGKYAGLAVAYGRNGWKAGYGSFAFGKAGWSVNGWEDTGVVPELSGFSFQTVLKSSKHREGEGEPPSKRHRH